MNQIVTQALVKLNSNKIITIKMTSEMPIPDLYRLVSHHNEVGIEGYDFQKKYCDPLKQVEERQLAKIKKGQKPRKAATKRGNFLDDECKMRKIVPGPGAYPQKSEWSQKQKLKRPHGQRKTYIQQIIQHQKNKKNKKPGPGAYDPEKTLKEIEAENKRLASRKITVQDRLTYLDGIMYQASKSPGVGNYNPRQRAKTEGSTMKVKPQDWRKKHEAMEKKKLPKAPDMRTYHPLPSTYTLLESASKIKENKNLLGKVQRFKTSPSATGPKLGPQKYGIVQEWRGKDTKKKDRHGLEVLAKSNSKSVYYN